MSAAARRANRLTGCGERRHRTRECDEKSAGGDSGPDSIAIGQESGKRDAVRRPHRPEVAAPDVGGGLTEFAGNEIGEKHGRDLHDEFGRGRQPASDGVARQEPGQRNPESRKRISVLCGGGARCWSIGTRISIT